MTVNISGLTSELLNDPVGYGYSNFIQNGDDAGLAFQLNLVRTGSNGGPQIIVKRSDISKSDVWHAIDVGDYTALPANPNNTQLSQERRFLSWMEGLANIDRVQLLNNDGSDTQVFKNFNAMFPSGTGTRDRLLNLATRNGSRSEQLFGTNSFVTILNIAQALGRG
jgi:hypothetical protein